MQQASICYNYLGDSKNALYRSWFSDANKQNFTWKKQQQKTLKLGSLHGLLKKNFC